MENNKLTQIEFQKKRVEARDKIAVFKKKHRFVPPITAAFGIAFFIIGWYFAREFYDMEMPFMSLACLIAFVILTALANVIAGGIISRSVGIYIKNRMLSRKWKSASLEMEKEEAKTVEHTAYEGDVSKAEIRLMAVSDEVIEKMKGL